MSYRAEPTTNLDKGPTARKACRATCLKIAKSGGIMHVKRCMKLATEFYDLLGSAPEGVRQFTNRFTEYSFVQVGFQISY